MKIILYAFFLTQFSLLPLYCAEMPEGKTASEILKPLEKDSGRNNLLNRILSSLSFDIAGNNVIAIPIFQNNKDLGSSYGIMPVAAINSGKEENPIRFVIAPSYDRNEKLGDTISYRHYYFPDEKSIMMGRISSSSRAQKELVFWYYSPSFLMDKSKFSFYAYDYKDPKFSFYGYGPKTSKKNGENYLFLNRGFDSSITTPISGNLNAEYTLSLYSKKINNGIFGSPPLFSQRYPADYAQSSVKNNFFINKLSMLLDTTDHPFLPKLGNYLIFSFAFSAKPYSDYSYSSYSIESKKYYNYSAGKYVTAVRYFLSWQTGNRLPFYENQRLGESSGLRMAGEGRFTDRAKFMATVEQRITLSKSALMKFLSELEFTPFLDIGTVAPSVNELRLSNLKYGPGAAFRIILRPHVVATADLAFGSEGSNLLIKVGYPF
ncbi:MAG: hypothetical protein Fur0012_01560 [Elusimicrobiota bacterium]